LALGPGVGSAAGGILVGLSGEYNPVEATVEPYFPPGDPRFNGCAVMTADQTWGLNLTPKAWLGKWGASTEVTFDALQGRQAYAGSPWHLPAGCRNMPPDSLFGPGVTRVGDAFVGGAGQAGYAEGFVPGQNAWVLSTGLIADSVGAPVLEASTDLESDGAPELGELAGHPTFDAAIYQVTLVPAGSSLHIGYVFASEEYLESVGSDYKDVMAVRVNGTNCATVPGGPAPVSVNTVNPTINSSYYVDNSGGADGYSTTMDGLTVPLTCSVPVTPGQPVTVQIAVADTSDHVLDSAVALVDGGIWAD